MYPALEAAWAKYQKASRDLSTLHTNAARFFEREPYGIVAEMEDDGWHVVRIRVREDPPPVFGVLVGSVAHQAYSALNHVAWELVVRHIGEEAASKSEVRRKIEFPICDKRKDFENRAVLGWLDPDAVAAIERLQPFHRPRGTHGRIQHPLLLMKELADADKHRVLPATYGSVDLRNLTLQWDSSASEPTYKRLLPKHQRNLDDGAAIGQVRFAHGNDTASVRVSEQPKVDLVIESDTWYGLSLFSVGDCVATADRCISEIAPLFGEESWPVKHDPQSPYTY